VRAGEDFQETDLMLLENRIAFVTGAASGIGAAGARAMAREGAFVVVTDRDGHGAEAVAATRAGRLRRRGARTRRHRRRSPPQGDRRTAESHGRLDVLHSHAGIQIEGKLEEVTVEEMDASWRLNVRSHFVAAQAALAPMRRQGRGSIIITSSNSGRAVRPRDDRLCDDQACRARHDPSDGCRLRAREHTVQRTLPRLHRHALQSRLRNPDGRARDRLEAYVAKAIPMGRFGTVEEIADAIVFLASDRSSFMTGHALVVDGGECI
jgi:NAD(P)-dependent dehydrogenase (short-subunit alcohol dehydrogenase family)